MEYKIIVHKKTGEVLSYFPVKPKTCFTEESNNAEAINNDTEEFIAYYIPEIENRSYYDGKIFYNKTTSEIWVEYFVSENKIATRILELKSLLNRDDYKVVKCAESLVMNKALPYENIKELITQRDTWRVEINDLEKMLRDAGF